jgi:hypothetical protein
VRRNGKKIRARLGGPKPRRKRRKQPIWGGPPGHRAGGKKVSFFLFLSYINLFSKAILKWVFNPNENKIKTTPQNKTNATA